MTPDIDLLAKNYCVSGSHRACALWEVGHAAREMLLYHNGMQVDLFALVKVLADTSQRLALISGESGKIRLESPDFPVELVPITDQMHGGTISGYFIDGNREDVIWAAHGKSEDLQKLLLSHMKKVLANLDIKKGREAEQYLLDHGIDLGDDEGAEAELQRPLAVPSQKKSSVETAYERKQYAPIQGYEHCDELDLVVAEHAYIQERRNDGRGENGVIYSLVEQLARHDFPLYLVTKEVHRALLQTDLPKDLDVADLQIPFPAMLICLPTELSILYQGNQHLSFLIGDTAPGIYEIPDGLVAHPDPSIGWFCWGKKIGDSTLSTMQFEVIPKTEAGVLAHIKALESGGIRVTHGDQDADLIEEEIRTVDSAEEISAYLIKLILFLNALPDQVQEQVHTKSFRTGEENLKVGVWRPRFIGHKLSYFKRHEPDTSLKSSGEIHGTKKRMHWRRGHFRRVAIGTGRMGRKRVWFPPTIVNAPPTKPALGKPQSE